MSSTSPKLSISVFGPSIILNLPTTKYLEDCKYEILVFILTVCPQNPPSYKKSMTFHTYIMYSIQMIWKASNSLFIFTSVRSTVFFLPDYMGIKRNHIL